jgi:hypothetical protein
MWTGRISSIVIGNAEDKIGEMKVVRYFGEDGSVAELVSGSMPAAGDVARLNE